MDIKVNINDVKIKKIDKLNSGEYNIHFCNFTFSQEYENLVLVAIFSKENEKYKMFIENNTCTIPNELLKKTGYIKIGVYAYKSEDEDLILRYSPKPTVFFIEEGSYDEANESEEPTPSQIEQLGQLIQNLQTSLNSLNNDIENIQEDLQANINSLSTQIEGLQQNLSNLSNSFDELNQVSIIKEENDGN